MHNVDITLVYKILKREVAHYKVPVVDLIEIQTKDPFKVLISAILSTRTKDETTVRACERLFTKVRKIDDLERISVKDLEKLIFPVGFFKNKAKFLKRLPSVLQEHFNGRIPHTVEELVILPGVGRKVANLVVAVAFQKPAVCVDVHVHRIMNRLGYVKTKNPYDTEMALRKKLPMEYWEKINSMLVAFGQNLCRPVSPKCSECHIYAQCNRVGVRVSR
ncbi:MAG TPA: endonuclease III [Candidatus Nanoarchaeia archaeon]|nr:endonuclease III [Candidatus Nanoarchaeia archaeon]